MVNNLHLILIVFAFRVHARLETCIIRRPMDRDVVLAQRESRRILAFLTQAVEQGRMTAFEKQLIRQEASEVMRQAGYFDQQGRLIDVGGEENAAVARLSNHLQRKKLAELHPEQVDELATFIEERPYHPLPEVPPHLARPNVALDQYKRLLAFIDERRDDGSMQHGEAHDAYQPGIRVFEDSGASHFDLNEKTEKAVLVQATHLIRKKLLEIHPEFADQIRNLEQGRGR